MPRKLLLCASAMTVGLLWSAPQVTGQIFVDTPPPPQFQGQGQPSTRNGEWPSNGADLTFSRYSPLDQINASNFDKLQVAWRFKTDNLGPYPEYKLEGTPIMIKGVLYATAGTRRSVIALDAKTGELIWSHSLREGTRATHSPRQLSGRGVSYWTDGAGDERIIYVTTGYRLVQLNAKTGEIAIEELVAKLKAVTEARGGMDERIYVRGDRKVDYGTVMRVMGRLSSAGFRRVALVTEVEQGS